MAQYNEMGIESISENAVADGLIDELYILKSSLVKHKKLTRVSLSYINQMPLILEDNPEMCQSLYNYYYLLLRSTLPPQITNSFKIT